MPKQFSKEDVRRAMIMRLDGCSRQEIADEIGCTRHTIRNWETGGRGTDYDHWDDYFKEQHEIIKVRAEAETVETEVKEVHNDWSQESQKISEAISEFTEDLAEGEVDLEVKDLKVLYNLKMRMDNRSKEVNALMKRFMKKAFLAANRVLSEHKFNELKAELEEVEKEMMKEYDPELAEIVIRQNEKLAEVYYDDEE